MPLSLNMRSLLYSAKATLVIGVLLLFIGCKEDKLTPKSQALIKKGFPRKLQRDYQTGFVGYKVGDKWDCRERTWEYRNGVKLFASEYERREYKQRMAQIRKQDEKKLPSYDIRPNTTIKKLIDFRLLKSNPEEKVNIFGLQRPRIIKVGKHRLFFLDGQQRIVLEKYIPCRKVLVAEKGRAVLLAKYRTPSPTIGKLRYSSLLDEKGELIERIDEKHLLFGHSMFITPDLQRLLVAGHLSFNDTCQYQLLLYDRQKQSLSDLRVTRFAVGESSQNLITFQNNTCSCRVVKEGKLRCAPSKKGVISKYRLHNFEQSWTRTVNNKIHTLATTKSKSAFVSISTKLKKMEITIIDEKTSTLINSVIKEAPYIGSTTLRFWPNDRILGCFNISARFWSTSTGKEFQPSLSGYPAGKVITGKWGFLRHHGTSFSIVNTQGKRLLFVNIFNARIYKVWSLDSNIIVQTKASLYKLTSSRINSFFHQR